MSQRSAAEVEVLLDRGDWLLPGDVATLLGVSRKTVDRLLTAGTIKHKKSPGGWRTCDPADVRTQLASTRKVHGGE